MAALINGFRIHVRTINAETAIARIEPPDPSMFRRGHAPRQEDRNSGCGSAATGFSPDGARSTALQGAPR
jgi:hypothetical protein